LTLRGHFFRHRFWMRSLIHFLSFYDHVFDPWRSFSFLMIIFLILGDHFFVFSWSIYESLFRSRFLLNLWSRFGGSGSIFWPPWGHFLGHFLRSISDQFSRSLFDPFGVTFLTPLGSFFGSVLEVDFGPVFGPPLRVIFWPLWGHFLAHFLGQFSGQFWRSFWTPVLGGPGGSNLTPIKREIWPFQ